MRAVGFFRCYRRNFQRKAETNGCAKKNTAAVTMQSRIGSFPLGDEVQRDIRTVVEDARKADQCQNCGKIKAEEDGAENLHTAVCGKFSV